MKFFFTFSVFYAFSTRNVRTPDVVQKPKKTYFLVVTFAIVKDSFVWKYYFLLLKKPFLEVIFIFSFFSVVLNCHSRSPDKNVRPSTSQRIPIIYIFFFCSQRFLSVKTYNYFVLKNMTGSRFLFFRFLWSFNLPSL